MGVEGLSEGAEAQNVSVQELIRSSKEECLKRVKALEGIGGMINECNYFKTLVAAYESLEKLVKPDVLSGKEVSVQSVEEIQRAVEQTVRDLNQGTGAASTDKPKQFGYDRQGLMMVTLYLESR